MDQQFADELRKLISETVNDANTRNAYWIALIAAGAAIFGAILAFVAQLISSLFNRKSANASVKMQGDIAHRSAVNNISDKRQVWIIDLRKDIASFLSLWIDCSMSWAALVCDFDIASPQVIESQIFLDRKKLTSELARTTRSELSAAHCRILLCLNGNEKDHQKLREVMNKMISYQQRLVAFETQQNSEVVLEQLKQLRYECLEVARSLLKKEWDRLRDDVIEARPLPKKSHPSSNTSI